MANQFGLDEKVAKFLAETLQLDSLEEFAMFGADVARSASALARATLAGVGSSAERAPGEDSLEHHVERRRRLLGLGGRGRGREVARSMVCSLLSTCTCYMAIEGCK